MVWSVRHRDGWCAIRDNRDHGQRATSVPTACGMFVTLPWGQEQRDPDCPTCVISVASTTGGEEA